MRIFKQALAVLAVFGTCTMAWADIPGTDPSVTAVKVDTVVIVGTKTDTLNCREATVERARWLADKASRDGDYQRAGECYLAAGEPALADQSFVKAVGPASADSSRRLAANLDQLKSQARQLKQAFQRR
jgi:hypothetical protein